METTNNHPDNGLITAIMGLLGISVVVFVHELGHFLAAHYFNIPVTTFSLGFGPRLFSFPIGSTIFQLCLLPLGGYVALDEEYLSFQPYYVQMTVILAGIVFNFLFSYALFAFILKKDTNNHSPLTEYLKNLKELTQGYGTFIGPIGIIRLIGKSFLRDIHFFWFILALISLNIGIFNLIPLPFFDGGKALQITLHVLGII
jgi:membrane-associated protease RseP (regulator of RpoE activity)